MYWATSRPGGKVSLPRTVTIHSTGASVPLRLSFWRSRAESALFQDGRKLQPGAQVNADVCIIGAGFTGISSALHLLERGYNVHVVEANRVGWGASGRNGGQIINGIGGLEKIKKKHGDCVAEMVWDMRWRYS